MIAPLSAGLRNKTKPDNAGDITVVICSKRIACPQAFRHVYVCK